MSYFALFSISACFNLILMVGSKPSLIITRMIHYQSPQSPIFNPNATMLEHSRDDLERSIRRASYVAGGITTNAANIEATMVNYVAGFMVQLKFGSREIPQWLIMDTGSALTWVHCKPSEVPNVEQPLFNPHESRSFRREFCHDANKCTNSYPVIIGCLSDRICHFVVQYGFGSVSGFLGRESVRFGKDILTNVTFGCTKRTDIHKNINGVLGLRWGYLSLPAQKHAPKFGYCIGTLTDTFSNSVFLMGGGVRVRGVVTRLYVNLRYVVSVEEIRVGGVALDMRPETLRRNHTDGSGGMVLDSGSTYTFLPGVVVKKLESTIEWELLDFEPVVGHTYGDGAYDLKCYKGWVGTDLGRFPAVEIVFEDEAVLKLTALNLFRQYTWDAFCAAIIPKETIKAENSLMGIIMQQSFYVAFDVEAGRVGFNRIDCAKFESFRW